eukprot:XP_001699967.1 predicted protein [Chlamydomonas reinhardtii]
MPGCDWCCTGFLRAAQTLFVVMQQALRCQSCHTPARCMPATLAGNLVCILSWGLTDSRDDRRAHGATRAF